MFNKILLILAILIMGYTAVCSQSIDKISRRCPHTNIYGSVLLDINGDIDYTPCPARKSFFDGKLMLWDKDFINFQSADCIFCLGDLHPEYNGNTYRTISNTTYFGDIEPIITLTNNANATALFTYPQARATTNGRVAGVDSVISSYGNKIGIYTGNLTLAAVSGSAYVRSQNETAAYGGYFEALTGGNSAGTNTTPLYGIYGRVYGGHNGTTPLAVAGTFDVSNIGGGGVGNITEGIGVQVLFDGGSLITNYTNAKGIALQGWSAASGGQYTNSYGIYADTSIDRGVTKRYFIYSLSTSPSLYSGDVYINDSTKGIILTSPDGSCYRFTVANGGALNAGILVTCP